MAGDSALLRGALESASSELDVPLTAAQLDALVGYVFLLDRWNSTYNITAIREPGQMLVQHVFDCLAVLRPAQREAAVARNARLLDVGSGGGLPGLVLATCDDRFDVTCVDSVGKKVAFIRQVAADLSLKNVQAIQTRVENISATASTSAFGLITSRAFASLELFTRLTRPLLDPHGVWMAMKGKVPTDEIARLPASVEVFHVEHLNVPCLGAARCIVWMRPARSL